MEWYSSKLEKKYALNVLWCVKNNPGMTKTDIVRMDRGGEKTKYNMLSKLINMGLITTEKDPTGRWNTEHLVLTEDGAKIAECIETINQVMANVHPDENTENESDEE